jgi:TIR domain
MKVFISWSGPRSHQIALAFREWLPKVLPQVRPWVSSEDIDKGARWNPALTSELDSTWFGILCLVPENARSDWVIFEAGAIARSMERSRVAPFLMGVEVRDIPEPLAQFQCTRFEKEDVRKLVHSINRASSEPIEPRTLDETFDRSWPALADRIASLDAQAPSRPAPKRVSVAPLVEGPVEDAIPKEQVAILKLLTDYSGGVQAGLIAAALGENLIRTQYHLDRLKERRMILPRLVADSPTTYSLADAGRTYLVENNLV